MNPSPQNPPLLPSPPVRILVVDDHPENLRVVGEMLERSMECDLSFALDGESALQAARTDAPEIILLDIIMPGMDGFEVCRRLKETPQTADIPVLFLTARADSHDLVQGFAIGAADYIAKPFSNAELLARVQTHTKIARATRSLAQKNEELRQLLHILCHDLANPVANIASLISLCRDGVDVKQILPTLASSAQDSLDIIGMVRQMRAIEEGKLRPALSRVFLHQACTDALENLRLPIASKKIQLKLAVPEDLSVLAEPIALVHSVLANVFSNAIKFSYEKETVCIEAQKLASGEVQIDVVDEGIGIPEELLCDLFDITRQTSRPGTRGEHGTGFGMILMKNFMDSFAGRIEIVSRARETDPENSGTQVRLIFPPLPDEGAPSGLAPTASSIAL
jgi:two-component system sensor histidine kinase/response regulator